LFGDAGHLANLASGRRPVALRRVQAEVLEDSISLAQLGEQRRLGGSSALATVSASAGYAAPLARFEYAP
jgi:hypothetical protein